MEVLQNGVELLHELILLLILNLDAGKPADVLHIFLGDHVIPRYNTVAVSLFQDMISNRATAWSISFLLIPGPDSTLSDIKSLFDFLLPAKLNEVSKPKALNILME
jgi:hypothetical protein